MTYFKVAELYFGIDSDRLGVDSGTNYAPFLATATPNSSELIFTLRYATLPMSTGVHLTNYTNDNGTYSVYSTRDYHFVECRASDGSLYRLMADCCWRDIQVADNIDEKRSFAVINDFIMIAFTYAAAARDTVMIHASTVSVANQAVAFIGASGAGKSTHSQLWIENIEACELINDDQPALRIVNNIPYIYGTPWSGKRDCYRDVSAEVVAFFSMKQAQHNMLVEMSSIELFRELIGSCSMIRGDRVTMSFIVDVASRVAGSVCGAWFENRPEPESVFMSYNFSRIQQIK